jgi:hypothetical protein
MLGIPIVGCNNNVRRVQSLLLFMELVEAQIFYLSAVRFCRIKKAVAGKGPFPIIQSSP